MRTDYLTVTAPLPEGAWDARETLRQIAQVVSGGQWGSWVDKAHGYLGYEHCATWEHGGAHAAWGGQAGTVMLTLPGQACELVPDWPRAVEALRDALGGRITRWDGAADDRDGLHDVDEAAEAWLAGGFNCGGRPPKCSQAGNWLKPDGSGRTLYVGKRSSGKLCRVYEKGKQQHMPRSPWVRWEVELHRVDREIPWEAILDPRPYIAGAYPALAWIADATGPVKIPTTKERLEASMDHLVFHARRAYGALISVLETVGASAQGIVDLLRRDGVPARLVQDEYLHRKSLLPIPSLPMPGWVRGLAQDWILLAGGAWVPDVEAPYWWESLISTEPDVYTGRSADPSTWPRSTA